MGQGRSAESSAAGGAEQRWGGGLLAPGELRGLAVLVCCGLLTVLAYRELLWLQPERSLPEEIEEWFFVPSQSITPVVVLMSLWLLYRRVGRLRSLPSTPGAAIPGAALLLAAGAVYLWATYTGANDLLVPSLMLNGLACAWLRGGRPALRVVLLPVAFLLFAMPLSPPLLNEVVFRLQIWTADLVGGILYAVGIPNFVAGERILRADQTFSIIESCSGLRSMETLTMVAVLMVDLFRRRGLHAWLVVLAAPPTAFLLNGLRAVLLILNPHSEIVAVHNLQGVAILLSGLVILFLWDGLLEHPLSGSLGLGSARSASAPPMPGAGRARSERMWAVAAALGLAAASSLWLPRWEGPPTGAVGASRRISDGIGFSVEVETDRLFLGSAGFRESFTRRFAGGGEPVLLFVGIGSRSDRHRSALSPKTALPGSGWIVEQEGWATLEPDGRPVRMRLVRRGSQRQLVYHWYEGALSWPAELLRSLLGLDRSPWRRPGEIVAVRIAVPVLGAFPEGRRKARERLLSFYHRLRPLLDGLEAELTRGGAGKRIS